LAVWVKVRLKTLKGNVGKVVKSVAMLDTGYVSEKPEVYSMIRIVLLSQILMQHYQLSYQASTT